MLSGGQSVPPTIQLFLGMTAKGGREGKGCYYDVQRNEIS